MELPDGFELVRKLGEGGMGAVWQVRSVLLDQQFAVKQTTQSAPTARLEFVRELIAWTALPEHPNVLPCRFFRTIGNEILIFSDFADGGSLADAMAGGRIAQLPDVLDAAIQMARGLHVIHQCGYVHQDVKPQNALVAGPGVVRVSDFGLARTRAAGGAEASGGTPIYFSPEQAAALSSGRGTIGPSSDIWSWGACVLEMLIGDVVWIAGQAAGAVLDAYLAGQIAARIPRLPPEMAAVLTRALCPDVRERWASLAEPIDALVGVYEALTGDTFPRLDPPIRPDPAIRTGEYVRADGSVTWTAPRDSLRTALAATGRDPALADELLLEESGSRHVRMLADLYGFEWACTFWMLAGPSADAGRAWRHKAILHRALHDPAGALACWISGADAWTRSGADPGHQAQAAHCLANAASIARGGADPSGALAMFEHARGVYAAVLDAQPDADIALDIATTMVNEASLRFSLGPPADARARELYEAALTWLDSIPASRRDTRTEAERARMLVVIANESADDVALPWLEEAIRIRRALSARGDDASRSELALALWMLANRSHDRPRAIALVEEAIVLFERLPEPLRGLDAARYAAALTLRASFVFDTRGAHESLTSLKRAVETLERLVYREGHLEVVSFLVKAYLKIAAAEALANGNAAASFAWNVRGAGLLERSLSMRWNEDEAQMLVTFYKEAATDLRAQGREAEARQWTERARDAAVRAGLDETAGDPPVEAELEQLREYQDQIARAGDEATRRALAKKASDFAEDLLFAGQDALYERAQPILDEIRRLTNPRST